MQFMYPQFLWALSLLALPVLIHLFNFQRPKRVLFPNLRFLRAIQQEAKAARNLKHYLVLASRLLSITAMVLAFAQPVLKDQSTANKVAGFTSVYVDNSYSMQGYAGTSQLLDIGLTAAEGIVGRGNSASRYHLLTNDFLDQGQFFFSKAKTLDFIRGVQYSGTSRDAKGVLKRQLAAFQTEAQGQRPELFWISDFQKSTLPDLSDALQDTSFNLTLVPLSTASSANLYIDSAWTDAPFVQAGQKQALQAWVSNSGTKSIENLVVKLLVDDVQVSTAGVDIPAGGRVKTSFDFVPSSNRGSKAKLVLDDSQVNFDNTYRLVFSPAPIIKVVEIAGDDTPFIGAAFGNAKLFKFERFSASSINYTVAEQANLIVINGVSNAGSLLNNAQTWLKKGISVLYIPAYSPNQAEVIKPWVEQLLGGQVVAGADSLKPTASNRMAMPAQGNPFFTGVFEEQPKNALLPYAGAVPEVKGGSTVLSLVNGKPLLVQAAKGKGKFYVLTSSLSAQQTDLPRQGIFVPIMLRMALLSLPRQQKVAYSFQEPYITLNLDLPRSEKPFALKQGNTELVPGQQLLDGKLVMELPKGNLTAGFYDLVKDDSVVTSIAINYGTKESQLASYTREELEALAANHKHLKVSSTLDGLNQNPVANTGEVGTPLWYILLVSALVFLLLEILLLRFWK